MCLGATKFPRENQTKVQAMKSKELSRFFLETKLHEDSDLDNGINHCLGFVFSEEHNALLVKVNNQLKRVLIGAGDLLSW